MAHHVDGRELRGVQLVVEESQLFGDALGLHRTVERMGWDKFGPAAQQHSTKQLRVLGSGAQPDPGRGGDDTLVRELKFLGNCCSAKGYCCRHEYIDYSAPSLMLGGHGGIVHINFGLSQFVYFRYVREAAH